MQTSARKRINLLPGAFLSPELCDRAIANSIANYGRAGTLRRRSSKKFNTKRNLCAGSVSPDPDALSTAARLPSGYMSKL